MVNAAFAFIKRDFLLTASYKSSFAVQILTVPFVVAVAGGAANPAVKYYGTNYFSFLLIGIALIDYMTVSLRIFNTTIRDDQMMGTLEILFLSPIKLSLILFYCSLWAYAFTSLRFILYLIFGVLLFGLNIADANLIAAFTVLILSVLSFAALGVISATTIMLFKKGDWFRTLVTAISTLLGGVVYPISVLPDWLRPFSVYVPLTHSVKGMRQALFSGHSLNQLLPEIAFLLLFSLIFLPLSVMTFRLAVNITKRTGSLGKY